MAFKFSKTDTERTEGLAQKIRDKRAELEEAIDELNGKLEDEVSSINETVGELNELLSEANGVVEDIAAEMQGEFDDKSEKWQEGERGEATAEWINELDAFNLEEVEEYKIDPLEMPEDQAEALDTIQTEPSY